MNRKKLASIATGMLLSATLLLTSGCRTDLSNQRRISLQSVQALTSGSIGNCKEEYGEVFVSIVDKYGDCHIFLLEHPGLSNKDALSALKAKKGDQKVVSFNEFEKIEDLKEFAEKSSGFGGELKILKDKEKEIYIVDLQRTSGVVSTEAYIYQKVLEKYKLIKRLQFVSMHYRTFSFSNNKLSVKLVNSSTKSEELELELLIS